MALAPAAGSNRQIGSEAFSGKPTRRITNCRTMPPSALTDTPFTSNGPSSESEPSGFQERSWAEGKRETETSSMVPCGSEATKRVPDFTVGVVAEAPEAGPREGHGPVRDPDYYSILSHWGHPASSRPERKERGGEGGPLHVLR